MRKDHSTYEGLLTAIHQHKYVHAELRDSFGIITGARIMPFSLQYSIMQ